ncbi:MAG: pyridoxamine 5'-phosphate oxidase family protein [Acidimicrobiales bacterium]|jgi:general stress protein 26
MREPVTKVDERFGQAGAGPTSWDDTRAAIEAAQLFWVTSVRADGRPHVTPLVAVWCDDALFFSTGADEQKAVNLGRNSHVVLTTGCNEWEHGLDVVVEGDAIRETSRDVLLRVAEVWTHKWDGDTWDYAVGVDCFHHRDGDGVLEEEIYVYRVAPTKVLAFAKGPFSHTTHRF